ncbi:hypothetical protein J6590_077245 [Homalodisca vitripennis]|nr:hypothetical protein J6590_077245 [Homalodisca vitripennis]
MWPRAAFLSFVHCLCLRVFKQNFAAPVLTAHNAVSTATERVVYRVFRSALVHIFRVFRVLNQGARNRRPGALVTSFCGFHWGDRVRQNGGDESPELKAESQQIAAWQLLYRVQHPARYQSRLQTIPSPDIELPEGSTRVKPRTGTDTVTIDRAVHLWYAATGSCDGPPRGRHRLVKSHCVEPSLTGLQVDVGAH